jgi:hypothetical protein
VNGAVRRIAAGAVLLVAALFPMSAHAASSSFTIGEGSVVQVWAGNKSEVTIRAWNRPEVELATDDETVQVQRRPIVFGTAQNPLSVGIPLRTVKARDPDTGLLTDTTFAPEDFPYSADFHAGTHDTVRIVTGPNAHVTVMIPATVAILDARLRGTGTLTIDGYHGSTLFATSTGGRMTLTNIESAAFLQPLYGRLFVADSSFDRLRVRASTAALVFERDGTRQIEATTITGPILWDDGTFDAGLARFESTFGSIAIGVAGGAQVEARSGDGRVTWLWDKRTPIDARGDNEASATIDGGGPLVNAVTAHGDVFLFDGSLGMRRFVPPEWRRMSSLLREPDAAPLPAPAELAPMRDVRAPGEYHRFRELRRARQF